MDTQFRNEIIKILEEALEQEQISYICLYSKNVEYREICQNYLKALSRENKGSYNIEDRNTMSWCFHFCLLVDLEQERRKMIQWLIGYFLTWQPL